MDSAASIRERAARYYWYHCIDLGHGVVTDGDYEIESVIQHYGFPEAMNGLDVLDIGCGSGAFAFEFERRGAAVTATDLPSLFDWDLVGGDRARERWKSAVPDPEAYSNAQIFGAFEFAREVRQSTVQSRLANVYDLSPELFGGKTFDMVFLGSLMSHLRDPIRALERARSVTKGFCVVAAPTIELRRFRDVPFMQLVGGAAHDQRRNWWVMNERCLHDSLICAGFARVEMVGRLTLKHRKSREIQSEHAVAHAFA